MNTSKKPPLGTLTISVELSTSKTSMSTYLSVSSEGNYYILNQFAVDSKFAVSFVIYFVFCMKTNREYSGLHYSLSLCLIISGALI